MLLFIGSLGIDGALRTVTVSAAFSSLSPSPLLRRRQFLSLSENPRPSETIISDYFRRRATSLNEMIRKQKVLNSHPSSTQGSSTSDSESRNSSSQEGESDSSSGDEVQSHVRGDAKLSNYWASGEGLKITFNDCFQPVGVNAKKLASHSGILARDGNRLPLTIEDWRSEDLKLYKERVWMEVKESINAPEEYKKNCLQSLGKLWNNFKSIIKKKFYKNKQNDEERLANRPPRVEKDQWPILVKMWGTYEAKKKSRKNRRSRKKQKTSHTSGRKSHAVVADEMACDGIKPSCFDVYIKTHSKKNGEAADEVSTTNMIKMQERLSIAPQESSNSTNMKNEVFNEIMGPNSRAFRRTYGLQQPCELISNELKFQSHKTDSERIRVELRKEFEDRFVKLEEDLEIMRRHLEICPATKKLDHSVSSKEEKMNKEKNEMVKETEKDLGKENENEDKRETRRKTKKSEQWNNVEEKRKKRKKKMTVMMEEEF